MLGIKEKVPEKSLTVPSDGRFSAKVMAVVSLAVAHLLLLAAVIHHC